MFSKYFFSACVLIFVFITLPHPLFSQVSSDSLATQETKILYQNLQKLTKKGIMFGHQDDLAYGMGWHNIAGESDVKRSCGDYPAVYGWELGHLEIGSQYNLDSVSFDTMRKYMLAVHARGGVNTVSWHFDNPLTGGTAWDCKTDDVVKNVLPKGTKHDLFLTYLDRFAEFINSLKDEDGNAIPILFRPLHENTGGWFWWGNKQCTPAEYIQLWQYMANYLHHEKQLHNLILIYSPADNFETLKDYMTRYPGDQFVDILGFDCYQNENSITENFTTTLNNRLKVITAYAASKNKLATLSEMGFESIPDPTWWTDILWKGIHNRNISYVLLWRNAWNKPNHFYVPYPGQISEADFKVFFSLPQTLFQKDVTPENLYRP